MLPARGSATLRTPVAAGRVAITLLLGGLAWLAGVGAQLQQAPLPGSEVLAWGLGLGALMAGAGLGLFARGVSGARWRGLAVAALLLIGWGVLGWASTGLQAAQRLAERLPHGLEGRDLAVTGVVADLPQQGAQGLRFLFRPETVELPGEAVRALPPLLMVGWYSGWHEDATLTAPQASLRAGQRWAFTLRLRRPHGNLNPHGHDLELALFEQGVGAVGYVREGPLAPRLLDTAAGHPVARLRQAVRDAIQRQVPDPRAAGVLAALAIGDQSAIGREDWALYRDTGIAHLVSISGLHVTMFAWLAGLLLGLAWRLSARACLWLPAPLAARWGGLLLATAYAVLAGWGLPSQRTVLMLMLVTVLSSLGRRWPWPWVLVAAAVLVSLGDPWALLQPGFWLSFMAVGLLMASDAAQAQPRLADDSLRRRFFGALGQGLRTQWTATLSLTPLSLLCFQQVSVVGLLANLVAIPLVTLLITPLALLGVVWAPLWLLGAWLVQGLGWFLAQLAGWPAAVWQVPVAPLWAQAAGLLAALVVVLPWPWRLRLLALPLALPMLLPPRALPGPGSFELVALDVGQGTAVLVRTRHHLLMFDTGPQYARDSDAGQRILLPLLPLLRARGERRIDRLVLSHRDTDHVGGARALILALPVGEVLSSLDTDHPLLSLGPPSRRCAAGQRWEWDGVGFEVLQPPKSAYASVAGPRPNALSCVIRVSGSAAGSGSLLLTGDIERLQEMALVAGAGPALRSTVLIAPHHGSRSSSSQSFLEAVRPAVVVVQAGYRSRFGHPAPEVMARYRQLGLVVAETTRCGAWSWQGDALLASVRCERQVRARHWHDQPAPVSNAAPG